MKTKTNLKAGSGGDRPTESISFSYGSVKWVY
jgi:type VI protein secretion system component Hcp